MFQKLFHQYVLHFPVDYGKGMLTKHIPLPESTAYRLETNEGIHMELNLHEYVMKQIYLYGWYEKNTIKHLLRMLRPDWNCIDAGANIGFYTLTLAKHVLSGSVHAFEPNPFTLEHLNKNISLNAFTNIQVNGVALGSEAGRMDMTFSKGNLGTASAYRTDADYPIQVPVMTLDDYIAQAGLAKVQLIKADIEGGEKSLLQGAAQTLKRNRELVLVVELMEECCIAAGYHAQDLFQEIRGMGFRAYIPRPWPFGLTPVDQLPLQYQDNIIFIRK